MAPLGPKVSLRQRQMILEYLERHPELVSGRLTATFTKVAQDRLWEQLANTLNADGVGAVKDVKKWKKCWADWKSDTKAEASSIKKLLGATGGGEKSPVELTGIEMRLLNIMGHISVEGNTDIEEAGFLRQVIEEPVIIAPRNVNHGDFLRPSTSSHGIAMFPNTNSMTSAAVGVSVLPTSTGGNVQLTSIGGNVSTPPITIRTLPTSTSACEHVNGNLEDPLNICSGNLTSQPIVIQPIHDEVGSILYHLEPSVGNFNISIGQENGNADEVTRLTSHNEDRDSEMPIRDGKRKVRQTTRNSEDEDDIETPNRSGKKRGRNIRTENTENLQEATTTLKHIENSKNEILIGIQNALERRNVIESEKVTFLDKIASAFQSISENCTILKELSLSFIQNK